MSSPTLSDLVLDDCLARGRHSVVYRARTHDGSPRVVKMLEGEQPSPERIAWFRREHKILARLAGITGVAQPLALRSEHHRWFLILEDIGATSLDRLWSSRRMPITVFLDLAVDLVGILAEIHDRQVIHKDLNPSNLVMNPDTGAVQIIDFGISSILPRESPSAGELSRLEGTLAYMAPEQTGRTHRSVDERADLYALGATFYEWLVGRPPFDNDEPLDVLHGHLARSPIPPDTIVPDVDAMLAAIVLRLLAKHPEDRYRSCHGLRHDLVECRRRLAVNEANGPFVLARRDVPTRLLLPQKLYGRENDLRRLLATFEATCSGGRTLVLVAGYAGIGKSSLVRELRQPVVARRGFFHGGKFGQLERHEPYAPWLGAFGEVLREILAMDDQHLSDYRQRIAAALGRNARVVADVLPELTTLLGETAAVPDLKPVEARNRFRLTFQRLVEALAGEDHPLVVFLDDLQWADSASLELLETLLNDTDSGHLLILGVYRDHEVDVDHPLLRTVSRIRDSGAAMLHEMALGPLTPGDVARLLAETLAHEASATLPLAEVVIAKTGGNPFFLGRLIEHLVSEDLLTLDPSVGAWRWDVKAVAACDVTDNVIDLMARRVRELPSESRRILEVAACIGDVFSLETLSMLAEAVPRDVSRNLAPALLQELIVPLDDRYKLAFHQDDALNAGQIEYRFSHDRVRQAAYSLIDEAERGRVHWRLGHLLLEPTEQGDEAVMLFDIADQLGRGLAEGYSPATPATRGRLAEIFLQAGRKARDAAAYGPALHYFELGIRALADRLLDNAPQASGEALRDVQSQWPDLFFELCFAAAEAAHLTVDTGSTDRLLATARAVATSALDQARLADLEIQVHFSRSELSAAIGTGHEALGRLDIVLPETPREEELQLAAGRLVELLADPALDSILKAPIMQDPRALAAMRILGSSLRVASHHGRASLYVVVAVHMASLSLRHGPDDYSARSFGACSACLYGMGENHAGRRLGHLALELAKRFDNKDSPTVLVQNLLCRLPREWSPARLSDGWTQVYESALELGDTLIACTGLGLGNIQALLDGERLPVLERSIARDLDRSRQLGQTVYAEGHTWLLRALTTLHDDTASKSSREVDEALGRGTLDPTTNAMLDGVELLVRYVLTHGDGAAESTVRTHFATVLRGTLMEPAIAFLGALTHLRRAPGETTDEASASQVAIYVRVLGAWAEANPASFAHAHALVEAERARVRSDDAEARELYDRAILLAHENRFVHHEAMAHELAAAFHRARGMPHLARNYLRDARYAYERWGAIAKVRQLEATFPADLGRTEPRAVGTTSIRSSTAESNHGSSHEAIDLRAVLAASQALSDELELDKLLARLLSTVLVSAGAERVVLLLDIDGRWTIEAEGEAAALGAAPSLRVLCSIPLETHDRLLVPLILRVARTGVIEVLDDATHDGPFTRLPYVLREQPRSILCMPLVHQGRRSAILYLENNLAGGAFHRGRVELLELLGTEMAITLDNALLYRDLESTNHELEARVTERTRDLENRNRKLAETVERLRKTREQLVQQEKLAALGRMTAGVAHEMRNPLNFVNNFARLALASANDLALPAIDADPSVVRQLDELRANVARIEEHGRRAASIVDSMLLHARSSDSQPVVVDLDELIRQGVQLALHGMRARTPALVGCFKEDYEPVGDVEIVPQDLGRVVLNLLENAGDAVRQRLEAETAETYRPAIYVSTRAVGNHVEIRVRDNGSGIPEEYLDQIFEPFFTTKPSGAGTGLGLSVSYDIVRRHKGTLCATSSKGSTEITIMLPRGAAEGSADT